MNAWRLDLVQANKWCGQPIRAISSWISPTLKPMIYILYICCVSSLFFASWKLVDFHNFCQTAYQIHTIAYKYTGLCSSMDYKGFLSKTINIVLLISYDSQRVNWTLPKLGLQLKIYAFILYTLQNAVAYLVTFTNVKWRNENACDLLVFALASLHKQCPQAKHQSKNSFW